MSNEGRDLRHAPRREVEHMGFYRFLYVASISASWTCADVLAPMMSRDCTISSAVGFADAEGGERGPWREEH